MAECVHVILPVHDRRHITEQFLRCLAAQTYTGMHLVLIDDGSTDGTSEMARGMFPTMTLIRGEGDWWWGGGLQQGYLWASGARLPADDIILMINDDVSLEADFLQNAVDTLRNRERVLMLAQLYSRETGKYIESGVHVDWNTLVFTGVPDAANINCFSTRGLFLRAGDFVALGGFHPVLLPHYGSDYEFSIRAHRRGFEMATSPKVRLWMIESTTGIREVKETTVWQYLRSVFSKRNVLNPVYWTSFIVLACPPRLIVKNLLRVWTLFLRRAWAVSRGREL